MSGLSYSSPASYRGNLGSLSLEDGRLNFSSRSGLLSKKDYVIQSIPVDAIRSMHAQDSNKVLLKLQKPMLVIIVDTSKVPGIPRHEFGVESPGQWVSAIQGAIKSETLRKAESQEPAYVKEVVREVVKYPCPYCSSLIEVTTSCCPNCGAPQKR